MQLFSEKNPLSAVGCKIIKGIHTFRLQFSQERKNLTFTLQLDMESFVKWKFVPVYDISFNLCMKFCPQCVFFVSMELAQTHANNIVDVDNTLQKLASFKASEIKTKVC